MGRFSDVGWVDLTTLYSLATVYDYYLATSNAPHSPFPFSIAFNDPMVISRSFPPSPCSIPLVVGLLGISYAFLLVTSSNKKHQASMGTKRRNVPDGFLFWMLLKG